MARYKSTPREIEAEQYTELGALLVGECHCDMDTPTSTHTPHVHTAHNGQIVVLEDGDYVVPEPDGRGYYPIKPDIFEKNWEKVEATDGDSD